MQREYFKQGKVDQFRQILEEGSSPGIILHQSVAITTLVTLGINLIFFFFFFWAFARFRDR